jgi:cation:H+ antiporter
MAFMFKLGGQGGNMFLEFVLLIIGLILVIKGADYFVDAAVAVARRTGISEVVIGATLVSLATTLPELAVSSYSAYLNQTNLAVGNAVGSVIFNTGVILGLSVLLSPLVIKDKKFSLKAIFMLIAGIIFSIAGIDGKIAFYEGLILVTFLVVYMVYLFRSPSDDDEHNSQTDDTPIWVLAVKFIGGAMAVVFGSRLMVNSAISIAEYFGVSPMIIGLTIVAAGTSLPELATSLTSIKKGHQNVSVGNIVGANFLNMTSVLGISSLINPLPIEKVSLTIDLPVMLVFMTLIWLFGRKGKMERWKGIVFLLIYAAYFTNIVIRTLQAA